MQLLLRVVYNEVARRADAGEAAQPAASPAPAPLCIYIYLNLYRGAAPRRSPPSPKAFNPEVLSLCGHPPPRPTLSNTFNPESDMLQRSSAPTELAVARVFAHAKTPRTIAKPAVWRRAKLVAMEKRRLESIKRRTLGAFSNFVRGRRSLMPFRLVDDPNENALHAITIWLVWATVLVIGSALMRGVVRFTVVETLDFASSLANVCGGLWIAAGVIYKRPSKYKDLLELQRHVEDTFAYASRNCLVGACLIGLGYALLLASKLPVVKALG